MQLTLTNIKASNYSYPKKAVIACLILLSAVFVNVNGFATTQTIIHSNTNNTPAISSVYQAHATHAVVALLNVVSARASQVREAQGQQLAPRVHTQVPVAPCLDVLAHVISRQAP